ncbi:MAG: transposase [Synechococcaceae cyanobacterium]
MATDHEISHGRTITWTLRAKQAPEHIAEAWIGTGWIVEVVATGSRDGQPFQATHLFLSSLRTTPEALLRLVRDRWSIEGWHWIRDTQLHEDAHRYRGNGAGAMAMLRTAALNLRGCHESNPVVARALGHRTVAGIRRGWRSSPWLERG